MLETKKFAVPSLPIAPIPVLRGLSSSPYSMIIFLFILSLMLKSKTSIILCRSKKSAKNLNISNLSSPQLASTSFKGASILNRHLIMHFLSKLWSVKVFTLAMSNWNRVRRLKLSWRVLKPNLGLAARVVNTKQMLLVNTLSFFLRFSPITLQMNVNISL